MEAEIRELRRFVAPAAAAAAATSNEQQPMQRLLSGSAGPAAVTTEQPSVQRLLSGGTSVGGAEHLQAPVAQGSIITGGGFPAPVRGDRPPSMWQHGMSPNSATGAASALSRTPRRQQRARVRLPDEAIKMPVAEPPCAWNTHSGAGPGAAPACSPSWKSDASITGGAEQAADVPETPHSRSAPAMNTSPVPPPIQRLESEFTLKTEACSRENEKWKGEWRHQMKARLSRRLGSYGSYYDPGSSPKTVGTLHTLTRKLPRPPLPALTVLSKTTDWSKRKEPRSSAEAFIDGHIFQAVCCTIITLNAVFIGIQVDTLTKNAAMDPPKKNPEVFTVLDRSFAILFLVEVLLRVAIKRMRFFCGHEWRWNIFDFVTAILTVVEEFDNVLSVELDLSYTRILRGFRMIRILRVIRVLRFFRELRLMVCSIAQSLVSLSWALVLLMAIIYLFTICFMHAVDRYLREGGDEDTRKDLITWYGSVPVTMYSLLMAISGGVDWFTMVEPLAEISTLYQVLFAFYVFFIIIGVLNVLTSVFVQRANELVKLDRDLVIQCQMVSNETFLHEMKAIFDEVDVDGTGTITWEKFWEYVQNEHVQAYFATQQLDTSDARELFNLLDADNKGEVKIEDFVMGCMKVRGQAKSSDMATLLRESKRMGKKTTTAMRKMDKQLGAILRAMAPGQDMSTASWFQTALSPSSHWGGSPTPASKAYRGSPGRP